MTRNKIIVIGGSAAGPKAASKARRLDQQADITIIQKEADLSMASCGWPYYIGGYFDDRNKLLCTPTGVVRDPSFFTKCKGITALTQTEVTSINREAHTVECVNLADGSKFTREYDKLVIATGSTAAVPPIPGTDLDGITTLQSMRDADYLRKIADDGTIKKAVVIGGGLIGIETCEALQLAGIKVTVVEMLPQILLFLDPEIAKLVENHIRSNAAEVITDNAVAEFLGENGKLTGVKLNDGTEISCELAVIAIGVRPATKLAVDSGLKIGATRAIEVNEFMQTSDPDIYAAGDCIETIHRLTGKKTLAPLGDLANLEGRVAGQNVILGNTATFPGTIKTGICKVFDFTAASTGFSETDARKEGFDDIVTTICAGPDKPGFMDGKMVILKMVADRKSGQILGVQGAGPGDVSKRIASAAIAVMGKLTVNDLINADLPYAPPFSLALDILIVTAHVLENKMLGRMDGISPVEVKSKIDDGSDIFMLDMRGPDEFEEMRLGVGEKLIPLGALRSRLDELPEDKDREIIAYCKISLRGYEAACFLSANGWNNVKVMEGGIMAWPYGREK